MTTHDTLATTTAIEEAEPILQHLLERMLPHLDDNDRDDLAQDVRLHLIAHVLPLHNAARGRWTTLAYTAIRHRVLDAKRRHIRARHATDLDVDKLVPDDADGGASVERPDWLKLDAEALGKHLTRRQREVYHALAAGGQKQHVAQQIGIRPDSLSQMIARIRQRLTAKVLKPAAC